MNDTANPTYGTANPTVNPTDDTENQTDNTANPTDNTEVYSNVYSLIKIDDYIYIKPNVFLTNNNINNVYFVGYINENNDDEFVYYLGKYKYGFVVNEYSEKEFYSHKFEFQPSSLASNYKYTSLYIGENVPKNKISIGNYFVKDNYESKHSSNYFGEKETYYKYYAYKIIDINDIKNNKVTVFNTLKNKQEIVKLSGSVIKSFLTKTVRRFFGGKRNRKTRRTKKPKRKNGRNSRKHYTDRK
jgi:hypothetical protein